MSPNDRQELIQKLTNKLRANQLIAFIGAGMSQPCYPSWTQLLQILLGKIEDPTAQQEAREALQAKDHLYTAAVIHHALGERRLAGLLKEEFARKKAHSPHIAEARYALLEGLPFRAFFTTNYDHFLHDGRDVTNRINARADVLMDGGRVFHLHGCADHPQTMVLSPLHYADVRNNPAVEKLMEAAAAGNSFLFLGYGLGDDNVRGWLERTCFHLGQSYIPQHFALVDMRKWTKIQRDLYRELYSIEFIEADLTSQGYPDIDRFLGELRREFGFRQAAGFATAWDKSLDAWYVDPAVSEAEVSDGESLDGFLNGWLEDENAKFLVLLGEFGTGKSSFARRAVNLTHARGKRRPLLIELRVFPDGAGKHEIFVHAAGGAEKDEEIERANREGSLVLILDAFDEMGLREGATINESFDALRRLVEDRAKVIITSRKELFLREPGPWRQPDDHARVTAQDFRKVYLQLFDEPRVEEAFTKRGKRAVLDTLRAQENKKLLDLARRPVLLDLIASYDGRFGPETRLKDLYERYIYNLLERGNRGYFDKRTRFADELAWSIQNLDSGAGSLPAEELEQIAASSHYGLPRESRPILWGSNLLVRYVNSYAFSHPTFREYLVAKQLVPDLQAGRYKPCKLTDPTIDFIRDMWAWAPPAVAHGSGPYEGMVKVPAGPFIYGQGDKPGDAMTANIEQDFWIDRFPVTNAEYLEFLKNSDRPQHAKWIDHKRSRIAKKLTMPDEYAGHPVTGVSWYGAMAYAQAKGKTLPTEQQWEKAARGEDGREYPWGDGFQSDRCNVASGGTTPVDKHEGGVSPYGCMDMAGNVWEWTSSDWGRAKVLRGGSWLSYSNDARCASRDRSNPGITDLDLGFRCART